MENSEVQNNPVSNKEMDLCSKIGVYRLISDHKLETPTENSGKITLSSRENINYLQNIENDRPDYSLPNVYGVYVAKNLGEGFVQNEEINNGRPKHWNEEMQVHEKDSTSEDISKRYESRGDVQIQDEMNSKESYSKRSPSNKKNYDKGGDDRQRQTVNTSKSTSKALVKRCYHVQIHEPIELSTWFNSIFIFDKDNNINLKYEGPVKITPYHWLNKSE